MIIQLNDKWRVGKIDMPPQWTLERRRMKLGKEAWEPVSFCQTRHGLQTAIHEKVIRGASFYPGSENCAVTAGILARIASWPDKAGDE